VAIYCNGLLRYARNDAYIEEVAALAMTMMLCIVLTEVCNARIYLEKNTN